MIGFQEDADWLTLWPISLPLQSMKTDLRLQRLVGKAQSPTVKMPLGSFPSSFWISATSCAPTSGENIFSIWIVERIEVDDIYKRTRNTEPIPSMNRTRSMFHLYIRHHVMRTAKILKFNGFWSKINNFPFIFLKSLRFLADFDWARLYFYLLRYQHLQHWSSHMDLSSSQILELAWQEKQNQHVRKSVFEKKVWNIPIHCDQIQYSFYLAL